MCVYVKRIEKKGAHGDRATSLTTYYDYEIHVNSKPVHYVNGYDTFWSHVRDHKEVEREALKMARRLKDCFDGARVWRNF